MKFIHLSYKLTSAVLIYQYMWSWVDLFINVSYLDLPYIITEGNQNYS